MNYLGYIKHIQRHRIRDIQLKRLTTDDLQDFIVFLEKSGHLDTGEPLSAKTLRNIFNMIHKALNHAVGRQLIYHNPASYVVLPKVTQPDIRTLTEKEIKQFIAAMDNDSFQIALILMLFCGLRLGECCALAHDDVRCENGEYYLVISKSLSRVTNFGAREGELKEDNPYLVANELGHYLDPGTVRKKLKAVAERLGIKDFHPHCLRHTYASQAVKSGVPLPYLSDLLGHESTAFTAKVYISLDLEGCTKALSAMSELAHKSFAENYYLWHNAPLRKETKMKNLILALLETVMLITMKIAQRKTAIFL